MKAGRPPIYRFASLKVGQRLIVPIFADQQPPDVASSLINCAKNYAARHAPGFCGFTTTGVDYAAFERLPDGSNASRAMRSAAIDRAKILWLTTLPTLDAAQESRLNRLINREVGRRMVRLGADPGSLPAKLRTRGGSQRAMAFMADHRSSIARQEPTLEMADG